VTALPPRRPWWKRKRWWAAAALWLLAMYPLLEGPYRYCAIRGWADRDIYEVVWLRPLGAVLPVHRVRRFPDGTVAHVAEANLPARVRGAYLGWWGELARDHAWPGAGFSVPHP